MMRSGAAVFRGKFSLTCGILALTGLQELQEYCGRSFRLYIKLDETVVLS
jgi:hypothetical protein